MSGKVDIQYASSSESGSEMEIGGGSDGIESYDSDSAGEIKDVDVEDGALPSHGLANVMAKILNKKIPKQTAILAKGNTDREILEKRLKNEKTKPANDIEIVGKVKSKAESDTDSDSSTDKRKNITDIREKIRKRKRLNEMNHVKPNILEKDKERSLQKIATRGVVQLFNAVKKQQKEIEEKLTEAGNSERRKDQVLKSVSKGQFLDKLKGTAVNVTSGPLPDKKESKKKVENKDQKEGEEPSWSILRDDYMTGATMKDWDRESDGDSVESGDVGDQDMSDDDVSDST